MYTKKVRFSLVSLLLCLGFVSGVSAAQNVRVLGTNTVNSKPKVAYVPVSASSKSAATTGAVTKKSVVTKLSPSTSGQTAIRQTAKMPTVSDSVQVKKANTERFPTVGSFGAAPTSYKVSTSSSSIALQGVNGKIDVLTTQVGDLTYRLDNQYMTADEIEGNYFLKTEANGLLQRIAGLEEERNNIETLQETVQTLMSEEHNNTIYDSATGDRVQITIVDTDDFVPAEVLGDELNN